MEYGVGDISGIMGVHLFYGDIKHRAECIVQVLFPVISGGIFLTGAVAKGRMGASVLFR